MLHHVTLEIAPGDADEFAKLLETAGFTAVDPPAALTGGYRWFERGGTQLHLQLVDDPDVPRRGHVALLVPGFDETVVQLEALGFEVEDRRRHWGARRVVVTAPGGHRIELMEAPPGGN